MTTATTHNPTSAFPELSEKDKEIANLMNLPESLNDHIPILEAKLDEINEKQITTLTKLPSFDFEAVFRIYKEWLAETKGIEERIDASKNLIKIIGKKFEGILQIYPVEALKIIDLNLTKLLEKQKKQTDQRDLIAKEIDRYTQYKDKISKKIEKQRKEQQTPAESSDPKSQTAGVTKRT